MPGDDIHPNQEHQNEAALRLISTSVDRQLQETLNDEYFNKRFAPAVETLQADLQAKLIHQKELHEKELQEREKQATDREIRLKK